MVIVIATYIGIVLSAGSLSWGFSLLELDSVMPWLLFFGAVWLLAQSQRWWWFHAAAMILTVLFAALGIALGIAPGWMLSASIFALIVWDLSDFHRRTRFEPSSERRHKNERKHLARTASLAIVGVLVSSILMWLRGQLTTEWGILVLLVFLLALPQVKNWKAGG